MADLNPKFDRIAKPAVPANGRDLDGKEALYSTAPGAPKDAQFLIVCPRCDVESGLSLLEMRRVAVPPVVWLPHKREVWARCPACKRRAWLHIRLGPSLRGLLIRA